MSSPETTIGGTEPPRAWPQPPLETPAALATGIAFGLVQPVLDLLGRSPEFLVAHQLGLLELVALASLAVLASALAFGTGLLLVRHAKSLGGPVVALLLVLSGCAVGWHAHRVLRLPEITWIAVPLLAAGAVWLWFRVEVVRAFVKLLAFAVLVFVAIFLGQGDVRRAASRHEVASGIETNADTPVFLLVFDEWSFVSILGVDGEIDEKRYPHLAGFAERATWFRNASSVSETTGKALASIVTGAMPELDQLPTAIDHPRSVFSLLGPSYRVRAYEPITRLCPDGLNEVHRRPEGERWLQLLSDLRIVWLHQVSPPPLAAALPAVSNAWAGFGDDPDLAPSDLAAASWQFLNEAIAGVTGGQRLEHFERFLRGIDSDPGTLTFFHSLLPHHPWEFLEQGQRYVAQPVPGLVNEFWSGTPAQLEVAYARYEAQVAFVDHLLGRFFARLQELGIYERSLIVILGDHGVSFRQGTPRREFVPENAVELAPIPFLLKAPVQAEGSVVERFVTTLDVLPTMLDVLDVESPWPLDGGSAFADTPTAYGDGFPFLIASPTRGPNRGLVRLKPELHHLKYETLAWKRAFLLVGPDGFPRFYPGPHRELVGREVSSFEVLPGVAGTVRFVASDSTGIRESRFLRGTLEAATGGRVEDLAVAREGRIVATAQAVGVPGRLAFTALLPPSIERENHGELELLLFRDSAGTNLQRLNVSR